MLFLLAQGVRVLGGDLIGSAIRSAVGSGVKSALSSSARRLTSSIKSAFKSGNSKGLIKPTIKVDTSRFDRAFAQYLKMTKKDIGEAVNTKAYYIARNAVQLTPAVGKTKIEAELQQPSRVNPSLTLAQILAIKGGLKGKKLTTVANKIKRARKATTNFLRSGWIPAVKALERVVQKKTGPKYPKIQVKGIPKGGGSPARGGGWKIVAVLWNSVSGGVQTHNLNKHNDSGKVWELLEKGAQLAIDKEADSTEKYLEKKMAQRAREFNRL